MNLQSDILAYQQGKLKPSEILERIRASRNVGGTKFGLSEGQRGLLSRQKLQSDNAVYNVPWCFRIREALDRSAFERACAAVYERYPIFRVHISDEGGEPHHRVCLVPEVAADWRDVSPLDEAQVLAELGTLARRPFALDRELPLRIHLLSRGAEDHFLLFVVHHIVVDGHSLPLIMAALWDSYDCAITGKSPPVRAPDTGFQDFVEWQRGWLESGAASDDLRYWQSVFAAPPPVLEWGGGREGARGATGRNAEVRLLPVAADLADAVRSLALKAQVGASVVFLAAYRLLLARISGQADIVIGTATMTRPLEKLDSSVGFFVNMIALRSTLSGEQSVADLLRAEQKVLAEAVDHGLYPFARLVRELRLPRGRGGSSSYQAAFGYVGNALMDWGSESLDGVSRHCIEPVSGIYQDADCDLLFEIRETSSSFEIAAKYDGLRLGGGSVGDMLESYSRILAGMVADPRTRVADLAAAEEVPSSTTANANEAAQAPAAGLACAHRAFEALAGREPEAIAVQCDGERISYGELNARANRLARYLRERGVDADSRVGLCCRSGPWFVVGLLAIMKAGAAYLPLDPAYPLHRLLEIVEDSAPAALLVSHGDRDDLASSVPNVPLIELDSAAPAWSGYDADDPDYQVAPHHLAYVIYTSGSTGRPKGVMVEHRSLAHTLDAVRPYYAIKASDRVLQFTSVSFDVSVLEIFLALTSGASIAIRNDRWIESPPQFHKLCVENEITIIHMPATLWHRFLVADGAAAPESLRVVVAGGERVHSDWIEAWRAQNPAGPKLFNQYGPTEATIVATLADLTREEGEPLIGRPLDGVEAHVVDEDGELAPDGATGELLIGGGGVARGYLNRPELTAERFVSDRFSGRPGARLYRTGDLVCRTSSGGLAFRGRADRQVKLRGFRIEPEEIEEQLARHGAVREAAVIVDGGRDQESRRLVAYLAIRDNHSLSVDEAREFAKSLLPEHMVPSSFVMLEEMPVGPTGKRDLNALPPLPERPVMASFVAPRTPLEEALASIFVEVLKVDRIGVDDNFFEQGGDSLSAAQVVARIRQLLDLEVPLPLLFEVQSVAELAEEIVAMLEESGSDLQPA